MEVDFLLDILENYVILSFRFYLLNLLLNFGELSQAGRSLMFSPNS